MVADEILILLSLLEKAEHCHSNVEGTENINATPGPTPAKHGHPGFVHRHDVSAAIDNESTA